MSFATMYSDDSNGSRGYVSDFQSSPNSEAVSPMYLKIEESSNKPYLDIIEQPADFRYRYEKEKYHGHILGISSPATKKKDLFKFPSVKVCNYDSDVIVRCWLITADLNEQGQAHVHKLSRKVPKAQVHLEPHDIYATVKNEFIAVFDYMYIVHAVGGEESDLKIYENKKNWLESGSFHCPPSSSKVSFDTEELKQMDKNQSILLFQAFDAYTKEKICESVVSRKIKNLHNAETAALKITNYSLAKGSCRGNDEVFMLVEKISKDVEVNFFTIDKSSKKRMWEARAIYGPQHVHHQYAIVFKTPEYCNTNISSPVEVFVELYRKTDGARSEPVRFTYLPDDLCNLNDFSRKRPLLPEEQTCLNNVMLSEASQPKRLKEIVPDLTTLFENCDKDLSYLQLDELIDGEYLISSLEEDRILHPSCDLEFYNYEGLQPDIAELLENPSVQSDSGSCIEKEVHVKPHSRIRQSLFSGHDDLYASNSLIGKERPDRPKYYGEAQGEIRMIKTNFKHDLDRLRALYKILVCEPRIHTSLFVDVLKTYFKNGFDINTTDFVGNSIFLLACGHSREVVSHLLGFEKLNCDLMNLAGDNALHCASRGNKIDIVQDLIKHNFDPNAMNYKSGDTSLHIAVENNNMPLIKLLIENGADPLKNNFASVSPYDISASSENREIKSYIFAKAQESLKNKPFKISPSTYFVGDSEITSKIRSLKNKFHHLLQKTFVRRMILHVVIPVVICSTIYLFNLLL